MFKKERKVQWVKACPWGNFSCFFTSLPVYYSDLPGSLKSTDVSFKALHPHHRPTLFRENPLFEIFCAQEEFNVSVVVHDIQLFHMKLKHQHF